MKTFKTFLNEGAHFDLQQFEKDCAFLLNQLKGTGGSKLLYRGTESGGMADWEIRDFRMRAKPRDSSQNLHDRLNDFFVDLIGEPIRNWMFVTGSSADARGYGKPYIIFPIGEFEWVCNADVGKNGISDMYGTTSYLAGKIFAADKENKYSCDQRQLMATDMLIKKLPHTRWNVNERLEECIESTNEIHLKCKRYYKIDAKSDLYYDVIKPRLAEIL